MLFDLDALGSAVLPETTQIADTIITQLVPPLKGAFTGITRLAYTNQGTAHVLTIMRPLNWTTFSADAASGQAVVNVVVNPGAYATSWKYGRPGATPSVADNLVAANDWVVYELPDGNYVLDTVASISGLAITLTTNVPTGGVKNGGRLWCFGVTTDLNPQTTVAHTQFPLPVSATTVFANKNDVFYRSLNKYDPLILHSDNATAAGTLRRTNVMYLKY